MRGLDPRIHQTVESIEHDGLPGQASPPDFDPGAGQDDRETFACSAAPPLHSPCLSPPRRRPPRTWCASTRFATPRRCRSTSGFRHRHGMRLELAFTDNSKNQRDGLAAGTFDVAQSALDNAVAMIEVARKDVVIVGGGDSGMNEFFVQDDIKSFADLRGRILVVDAPDTAYALQAKKILLQHGLKEGADYTVKPVGAGGLRLKAMAEDRNHAAAILNRPFTVQAEHLGLRSLGRTVDLLGPYQAGGAFVMRAWARDHADVLERYLAAYVASVRWVRDPANQAEAIK